MLPPFRLASVTPVGAVPNLRALRSRGTAGAASRSGEGLDGGMVGAFSSPCQPAAIERFDIPVARSSAAEVSARDDLTRPVSPEAVEDEPAGPTMEPAPAGGGSPGSRDEPSRSSRGIPGLRNVALLLAVAAALAAILAARSAMLSVEASDAWQKTLRVELQRAAAVLIDIRQAYGVEADAGLMIREEELLAEELRAAAENATPEIAAALLQQAGIHADAAAFMAPNVELADARYRLPDGGIDIERRLADLRAELPDLVTLDPDAHAEAGDRAFDRATRSISAALPLGLAFLSGALAMPLTARRRLLLVVGWTSVVAAVAVTLIVEVGA